MSAGVLIVGAGVGAGCMYLMDPDRGRARRALIRDRAASGYRGVRDSVEKAQTDLANRAHGLLAQAKSAVRRKPVDDDQLTARVRAKLGRLVSHPHAIDVIARDGMVTLAGAVLEAEAGQLVGGVCSTPGVSRVCDHLVRHSDAADVPSLQGGRERHPGRVPVLRSEWPPALRMLAGVAGGGLGLYGLLRSTRTARAVALPFGIGLLARGISSRDRRERVK
jgi:hypothetical protein